MATARELLAQADALMRRNRAAGAEHAPQDIPVLTEIVAADEGVPRAPVPPTETEPWLDVAAQPVSDRVPMPDADAGIPILTEIVADDAPTSTLGAPEAFVQETATPQPEAAPAPAVAGDDAARWSALAEDVRMQVLQRIDIFTDTGLHEQLAARLQPIVDRASADLVATINQQVGQLLRAYVAEAIEREIERWKHDGTL
jgi:hypothetical protein